MCFLSLGVKHQAPEGYPLSTPPLRIAVSPQPAPVQPQLLLDLLWINAGTPVSLRPCWWDVWVELSESMAPGVN